MALIMDVTHLVSLFCILTTPMAVYSALGGASRCHPMEESRCGGLGYNETILPNLLGHRSVDEAVASMRQHEPLLASLCSAYLRHLVCYLYLPVCTVLDDPIPPCRAICEHARDGCVPLLREFDLEWPEDLVCDKFPWHGLCVGHSGDGPLTTPARPSITATTTTTTTSTAATSTTRIPPVAESGQCVEFKQDVPLCSAIDYDFASFPNSRGQSRLDAAMQVKMFSPLVEYGCSRDLRFFICGHYAPICKSSGTVSRSLVPCRSVCERARNGCGRVLEEFGFAWPDHLACEEMPELNDGSGSCVEYDAGENRIIYPVEVEEPDVTPPDIPGHTCEAINVPMCQGISYNFTKFPNMLGHRSQEEAGLEVHQFIPLIKVQCSESLKSFLCSVYTPICVSHSTKPVSPCRSLCRRAKRGCEPLMNRFGFQWPQSLRCGQFPRFGDPENQCMDPEHP